MALFVAVGNLVESCSSICFVVFIANLRLICLGAGLLDDLNCVLFGAISSSMDSGPQEGGTVDSGSAAVSFLLIAVSIR